VWAIVAGASDADPTTVITIAVIGAGTIYELGWLTLLLLLLFLLIAVVQSIATRVGVAGRWTCRRPSPQYGGQAPAQAIPGSPAGRWSLPVHRLAGEPGVHR
jgi:hypothetical protein